METATGVGVVGAESDQHRTPARHHHRRPHVAELAQARAGRSGAVEQLHEVIPGEMPGFFLK